MLHCTLTCSRGSYTAWGWVKQQQRPHADFSWFGGGMVSTSCAVSCRAWQVLRWLYFCATCAKCIPALAGLDAKHLSLGVTCCYVCQCQIVFVRGMAHTAA